MLLKLATERETVRAMMKDEVESMMRMGAQITKMEYRCKSTSVKRLCINPRDIRQSYVEDGSLANIKCIHWMFNELPLATHQDVLPQRMSHMDLVVRKVERAMNITWASRKQGENQQHKNCLEHTYSKVLNDKKQTIINDNGTEHKRKPLVRCPRTEGEANGNPHYKKGKRLFYWYSKLEGMHWVR
jgi:hypothetical protein